MSRALAGLAAGIFVVVAGAEVVAAAPQDRSNTPGIRTRNQSLKDASPP
jgi:hypothetical protein